ncbi:hypothetical protein H4J57_09490 [Colwellia sp. BRX8-7]|jgi:uncharacterized protein (DUF2384 family)|nr:hypothetical protein [Colwellia sp. BRX8-7]MBA6337434.1 hypothetical protein [Colwellia sp. BRX8-7]
MKAVLLNGYTPKIPLENKAPIELLQVIGGNKEVLDVIEQIKRGDFFNF